MAIKPIPKKTHGRSAVSDKTDAVAMEARLVRIETLLDALLDSLQTLPQSPECVAGIQSLDQRMAVFSERLQTHIEEDQWVQKNLEKMEARIKSLENRATYWLGAIAVIVPTVWVLVDFVREGVFKVQ